MIPKTDVMIIGGGQAGLAASRCLSVLGIDHVVLERGAVAQRWRSERWNSLCLLTPNWMTRLPGHRYSGDDPGAFMRKDQVARMLTNYSIDIAAPVLAQTEVLSVTRAGTGFRVETNRGGCRARAVVVATGACDIPHRPDFARRVARRIRQVTLDRYKSPAEIAPGGVLVAGASASGIQIAHELQDAGYPVTLCVGQHTRLPRRYRGQDIFYWLDQCGLLNKPRDPSSGPDQLARQHSFQLIGDSSGRSLDLASFMARGGTLTGRLADADGTALAFESTLRHSIDLAEARQSGLLRKIDTHIDQIGLEAPAAEKIPPVIVPRVPVRLDMESAGIKTIVWATGYRRDYSWLRIPVFTPQGEIRQRDGVTPIPGLFTLGLPFMRRANSTFIDGVGQDSREISRLIANHLGQAAPLAA